jgi:hypothetical protein
VRRVALLFAVVGAVVTLVLPANVKADDVAVKVVEVGWWTSRPPAEQPGDGYEVAAGPDGAAQSVAALRLSIPATTINSMPVRLTETAGLTQLGGVLQVCTTADAWTAADPGALDEAPTPNCTSSTNLTRTGDGVWLGDLGALAPQGGEVSLMIVPNYQPTTPLPAGVGMTVRISKSELAATGGGAASGGSDDGFVVEAPPSGGDVFIPADPGSSFGVPAGGDIELDPAEQVTTTTVVPSQVEDDFALDPISEGGGPAKPWGRLIIIVPLCAAFGAASVFVRRQLEARSLLPS